MQPDRASIELPYALQDRLPVEILGTGFSLLDLPAKAGGRMLSKLIAGPLTVLVERSCPDRGPRRLRVLHDVQIATTGRQGRERRWLLDPAPAEILAELMMAQVEAEAAGCMPDSFEGLLMNLDFSVAARARETTRDEMIDLAESCGEALAKRLPKLVRYYPECLKAPRATVRLPSLQFPWAVKSYEPSRVKTFRF
jgi:hypothetical protein